MLYRLSQLIPVRFTSTYRLTATADGEPLPDLRMRSTWWQWRGRIARHRMVSA